MTLAGKKIGFGITASFCTLPEIPEALKALKNLGADLYPIVSENINTLDSRFHNRDEFIAEVEAICGRPVTHTITQAEGFGPKTQLDLMIVAPATGTTIARIAGGISDGAVTLATKATMRNNKPILLALFSNDALGLGGVNIMKLYSTKNIFFVPFGQDDPIGKPNSMLSKLALMPEAAALALEGKQLQPAIIGYG